MQVAAEWRLEEVDDQPDQAVARQEGGEAGPLGARRPLPWFQAAGLEISSDGLVRRAITCARGTPTRHLLGAFSRAVLVLGRQEARPGPELGSDRSAMAALR